MVTWRDGTASYGLEVEPVTFETVLRALAEGTSWRATARLVEVAKDTVCAWRDRGARHCRAVIRSRWRTLPVTECQRDDWWSLIHPKPENRPGATESLDPDGDAWGWWALAPVWRLRLGVVIGNHHPLSADRLVEPVAWVTDGTIPVFTSAPGPAYPHAVVKLYREWDCPPRRGTRGPHPKPRRRPLADRRYAHGIQHRTGGRITASSTAVVVGDPAAVAARLTHAPVSRMSHPRVVERDTLTPRQPNRRWARRPHGFSNDWSGLEKPWWGSRAYYQVGLPHDSWRRPLPVTEPTRGSGSPRRGRPMTLARAAGVTDPVWTPEELFSDRVSPLYWAECPHLEKWFPCWPEVHHGN